MSLNVRALKREYDVRRWARILTESRYIAVISLTGGRTWGRTNRKSRWQGAVRPESATSRFGVPKIVREAALRTRYVGLAELFRGLPAGVVYGEDIGAVGEIVGRAMEGRGVGDCVVVGGKFDGGVVGARVLQGVLEKGGEERAWRALMDVLAGGGGREVCGVLEEGGRQLVRVVDGGRREVFRAVRRM